MKLLVHIEQYDLVGILPSQLESIALVNAAMGVIQAAYVDNTADGFKGVGGFTRYGSMEDFLAAESGPFVAFSPVEGEDIRTVEIPSDAWLVFGPSMGFNEDSFGSAEVTWVKVPGGDMNSRDVVPIALWELSEWQVQ